MSTIPVAITFRGMDRSQAVEASVLEHAARLEKFSQSVMGCRVMVEAPHQHQYKGIIYHVRVHLEIPGSAITVSRDPPEHHEHEDVYVAIRDAFNAVTRRLEDYTRRRRSKLKKQRPELHLVKTIAGTEGDREDAA